MEPTSTSVVATITWKLLGGLAAIFALGAALVTIVVMCITTPRSPKEWAVGIISTVVSSIAGGSFVIQHFELQHWVNSPFGLVSMIGLVFACGLPGWAIVRWTFNYINSKNGATITQVVADVRNLGQ